jgi:hypothetical protein
MQNGDARSNSYHDEFCGSGGRETMSGFFWWQRRFLFGILCITVFASAGDLLGIQTSIKPAAWKADFVAGEDAGTLITENATFKERIRRALADDDVTFFPTPLDADQVLKSLTRADLFFFSGHTIGKLDPPMQAIQVNGGAPQKAGRLTAVEIRKQLAANDTGPRLVILVGCETMNTRDGVPPAFRLDAAFGIHQDTRGRAFLGYETPVVGAMADDTMSKMIEFWTKPNGDGIWPTIEEAVLFVKSPIKIVGDTSLRYRGRLGFRKGDSAMLDPRFQDPQDSQENVLDDGLPGKPGDVPARFITVKWSTYPRLQGDGLNYLECEIGLQTSAEEATRIFETTTADWKESSKQNKKGRANMRDEDRSSFAENMSALNNSASTSDGVPVHSSDESVSLYRNRFIIRTRRGKDSVSADFTSERLTVVQRAKELIDARWPPGTEDN